MIEHVVFRCKLLSVFAECRPCCPDTILDFRRFLVASDVTPSSAAPNRISTSPPFECGCHLCLYHTEHSTIHNTHIRLFLPRLREWPRFKLCKTADLMVSWRKTTHALWPVKSSPQETNVQELSGSAKKTHREHIQVVRNGSIRLQLGYLQEPPWPHHEPRGIHKPWEGNAPSRQRLRPGMYH